MNKFPVLLTVSELVRIYNLRAKSQLSQNFLLDLNLTKKIVDAAGGIQGKYVCEVGPGPGTLTRSILMQEPRKLLVIEKDSRFLPILHQLAEHVGEQVLVVRRGDILSFDLVTELTGSVPITRWDSRICMLHIIANLPFNVSLPLLSHWLRQISYRTGPFKFGRVPMTLIFQEEVGERIVAPVDHRERSRLSLASQAYCEASIVFRLPYSVFVPRPKVNAVAVHLKPLIKPKIDVNFDIFDTIAKSLFNQKRSMVKKGLDVAFPKRHDICLKIFKAANIDTNLRPANLSLEDINRICNEALAYKEHLVINSTQITPEPPTERRNANFDEIDSLTN